MDPYVLLSFGCVLVALMLWLFNEKATQAAADDNFDKLNLRPELIQSIRACGFKHPFAIQQRAIPPIIQGRHVIAQAQVGAGKTTAISISVLQTLDTNLKATQALILASTRELAQQAQKAIVALGQHMKFECHVCVGGTSVRQEQAKLQEGIHVVVGTPGRVVDMLKRGALQTDQIKILCLLEANELLSPAFKERIDEVTQTLPQGHQIVLLSAPMPPGILKVAEDFVHDPVHILIKSDEVNLEEIKQFYVLVKSEERKLDKLREIYEIVMTTPGIIFCDSSGKVNSLALGLNSKEPPLFAMHGKMDPAVRDEIMNKFCSGSSRVLVTTDLLTSINLHQVSLIINYDLPSNQESYMHRIRRLGSKGTAITFVTQNELSMLRELENTCHTEIRQLPPDIAGLI